MFFMGKVVGYMITWTTYGSWVQGDKRGYVKNGKVRCANEALAASNKNKLRKKPVKLTRPQRERVREAILEKGAKLNQRIYAVAVSSLHVHMVVENIPMAVGRIVRYYKNAGQAALRKVGVSGRVWTKGFDKRYCFDRGELKNRVDYVKCHEKDRLNTRGVSE